MISLYARIAGNYFKPLGFKVLGVATSYFIDKLSEADWAVRSLRPEEVADVLPDLKLGVD